MPTRDMFLTVPSHIIMLPCYMLPCFSSLISPTLMKAYTKACDHGDKVPVLPEVHHTGEFAGGLAMVNGTDTSQCLHTKELEAKRTAGKPLFLVKVKESCCSTNLILDSTTCHQCRVHVLCGIPALFSQAG